MICEYEWIVTVEVKGETEKETKDKLKKLKSELFTLHGRDADVQIVEIKRR
jgi:ribosomal protein L29